MKISLTAKEREDLIKLEREIPHKGIGIRIRIILALNDGYDSKDVARILLLDEDTITSWKKKYLEGKLFSDWLGSKFFGYSGKLTKLQESEIEKLVEEKTIVDSKEIVTYIKNVFGISYSVSGVTKLLHKLNFVYKKTVIIPGKLDPIKQMKFLEEYESLKKNLEATEKILFLDGVHPSHNTQKVKCWIKKGVNKEIRSNTGRKRLNIHGAFCLENLELVSNQFKTLDAVTTIEFFDQIQEEYINLTKIYCIADNARYYKNKDVKAYLDNKNCRIKLIFLPSYSPNLNFIERLWKYMKKYIIGTKYREKFKEFEEDISYFLNHTTEYTDLKQFIGTKPHLIIP